MVQQFHQQTNDANTRGLMLKPMLYALQYIIKYNTCHNCIYVICIRLNMHGLVRLCVPTYERMDVCLCVEKPYGRYDNLNVYLICSAETSVGTPSYKTHMRLTIFSVSTADYTTYKCVAKNPRGETDGSIRLYGKLPFAFQFQYIFSRTFILYNTLYSMVFCRGSLLTTPNWNFSVDFCNDKEILPSWCLNFK